MSDPTGPTHPVDDDTELRADSDRIERLLSEIHDLVPLPAWQRIEDLLRRVVHLYSTGLARALAHARAVDPSPQRFNERLCRDELLASLLLLHGLHPLTTEQRIREALATLRTELGIADDELTLTWIEDGVVHLAVTGAIAGAMSRGLAEATIRRVLESAAPEITAVEIAGLPRRPDPSLVQLRISRPAP